MIFYEMVFCRLKDKGLVKNFMVFWLKNVRFLNIPQPKNHEILYKTFIDRACYLVFYYR